MVALAGIALVVVPAYGDWPVGRHDAQRSGAAAGASDIRAPEESWRYYLGGSLGPSGLAVLDVDGDTIDDYVMVAGGSLVAKGLDDRVRWSVPTRGFTGIAAVTDLDGDGGLELVVTATASVAVVDARSGAVEWELPAGTMQQFGGLRVADLDGDDLDELVITEAGSCAANPGLWPGAVYGFAGGFGGNRERWQLPTVVCSKGLATTIFDADGDGAPDVLEPVHNQVQVLDGATGAPSGLSAMIGSAMAHLRCTPVEVDGTPGQELICMYNVSVFPADRSVMMLELRGGTMVVAWRTFLASVETGELRAVDLALDLGDGLAVVASTRTGSTGPWTTHVLDARTGALRTTLPDQLVVGSAPRPAGGRYLLTIDDNGLHGWRAGSTPVPEIAWSRLGDEVPAQVWSRDLAAIGQLDVRAAVLPGASRLMVTPRARPGVIRAVDLFDGGTTVAAEVELPPGVRADSAFLPGSDDAIFVMSRSDGFLAPYDELLVLQTGIDVQRLPRTGGYVATGTFRQLHGPPRTSDLDDDGRDEVVVGESRGALVRLDVEDAALHAPPRPRWIRTGASAPVIARTSAGAARIGCLDAAVADGGSTEYAVTMLDADGASQWIEPLPGPPLADLVSGNLDGDGVPDLVAQWGAPGDLFVHTVALAGTDGDPLFEHSIEPMAGRSPAGVSVGSWPGRLTDAVFHVAALHVWAHGGPDGTLLGQSPEFPIAYFLPTLVQLDGDAGHEVVLTGGAAGVIVLDDDLGTIYVSSDTRRPFPYGSIARCGDGSVVLASEALASPTRLLLTTLASGGSGLPVGTERALWLAGGALHADEAAARATGRTGQLTSSTSHADLTGLGRPSTLVGSSDGFLYAVDPCAGALDFAFELGAAVGEAVYGDGDGDGKDEILVTAGDGYLRALQHHSIDPPAWVEDLDPTGEVAGDVDQLPVRDVLSARWAEVAGATGYQVAVVDRDGDHVLEPPWRDVGGTTVAFPEVSTSEERKLHVLVRAIGSAGRSVDTSSDGVTLVADVDPEPPTNPGGCCNTSSNRSSAVLGLLILLSFVRRRAARRG